MSICTFLLSYSIVIAIVMSRSIINEILKVKFSTNPLIEERVKVLVFDHLDFLKMEAIERFVEKITTITSEGAWEKWCKGRKEHKDDLEALPTGINIENEAIDTLLYTGVEISQVYQ